MIIGFLPRGIKIESSLISKRTIDFESILKSHFIFLKNKKADPNSNSNDSEHNTNEKSLSDISIRICNIAWSKGVESVSLFNPAILESNPEMDIYEKNAENAFEIE